MYTTIASGLRKTTYVDADPKIRKMQAKHIPDQALIDLVDRLWNVPRFFNSHQHIELDRMEYPVKLWVSYGLGARVEDICNQWPLVPRKVIIAKLRTLVRQKKLDGCACGHPSCTGEFLVVKDPSVIQYWCWTEDEGQHFRTRPREDVEGTHIRVYKTKQKRKINEL